MKSMTGGGLKKNDITEEGCFKTAIMNLVIISLRMPVIGKVSIMSAIRKDLVLGRNPSNL